jgi:hypothetical protein
MPEVKQYFHDVDLKANQLFNSRLHNVTTSARISIGSSLGPGSRGYMVYDTDLGFPFFWNGVDWGEASGRQIPEWGEIIGDITEQLDLTTYLSGNYYPLIDNPAGYLTAIPSLDEVLAVGNTAYNDIIFYAASSLHMNSGLITFTPDFITTGLLGGLPSGFTDIRNWFLPDASGVIPLTVNNIAPDDFGNITISAGGGTLQEVTDAGNITDNPIIVGDYDTVAPFDYAEITRATSGGYRLFNKLTAGSGYFVTSYDLGAFSFIYTADHTSGIYGSTTVRPKIDGTYDHGNEIYFPDASGTLPLSVNGQTANDAGEITISTGGSTLQEVTDAGSTTTNSISVAGLNIITSGNTLNLGQLGDGGFAVTDKDAIEILKVTPNDLKFGGGNNGYVMFKTNTGGNVDLTAPNLSGTIALSVNNQTADINGNITIPIETGVLSALPFTTDHLATTNNQYVIGDLVYYVGNVYRCIASNDSLQPDIATQYWTLLGAGSPLVQQPADWNSTSGNNQILNKPTIGGSVGFEQNFLLMGA